MDKFKLNKSDYNIVGGYLIVVTFWLLYKFRIEGYKLREYFVDIPVFWIQTLALLVIAKWLIENYLIKEKKYFSLITLGTFSLWAVSFLTMLSGDFTRHGFINWEMLKPLGKTIVFNINNSVFNLCFPLSLIAAKKYYENQLDAIKMAKSQKEMELKLLRSQYDPHFLYNNLNTIDALIDYSSKETVKKYVANLAGLYRYLIKMKDEEIVSIEEELELVKKYLYLVNTRFENDYEFSFSLDGLPDEKYLPNGALLSVVENIVKHNKALDKHKIKVEIYYEKNHISVRNNKSNTPQLEGSSLGTGLKNLQQRYEILNNESLTIFESDFKFVVHLPLLKLI